MTPQLKITVDKLYEVFSKIHGNSNMQGSPNYGDLEIWNQVLFSKPLRELSANDLSRFTGKAMTTWGNVDDYKHFLPRILELTAQLDTPYEVWIAFDKLEYGNWKAWEETEQKVIHEYMLLLWESLLKDDSEKAEWVFMDYFSSIAHFYPRFGELLTIWERDNNKTATKHLANFIYNERSNIFDKRIIAGFHKQSENVDELKNWSLSDKTVQRLEEAYYRYEHEPFAETISWAEKMLSDERRNTAHNISFKK
jgi:hypothetical protein